MKPQKPVPARRETSLTPATVDSPPPGAPGWLRVVGGVLRLAVLLAVAVGALALSPLGKHLPLITHFLPASSKSHAHPTPPANVSQTPTPILYASGAPVAPNSAVRMGSPLAAFVSAFGTPIVRVPGVVYGFQAFCGAGSDDCEQVTMEIGQDGQPYVGVIKLATTPLHLWDAAQAQQICTSYMPADAQSIRSLNPSNDEQDHIYVSATLARIFPANVFINAAGHYIQPGAFEIAYHESAPGAASFTYCQLTTGIAQT